MHVHFFPSLGDDVAASVTVTRQPWLKPQMPGEADCKKLIVPRIVYKVHRQTLEAGAKWFDERRKREGSLLAPARWSRGGDWAIFFGGGCGRRGDEGGGVGVGGGRGRGGEEKEEKK